MSNILLIEPDYKCKYPPLGLMKIAYYHKEYRNDTVWFCKGRLPEEISDEVKKKIKKSKYYIEKYGDGLDKHIEEINNIIKENLWDKIHVTTLFTFEYDKAIEAIDYAKELVGKDKVFTGGIMATLMTDKLRSDTGITVNPGQLTNSKLIGYDDNINIDILTPDYSILDNTEYQYENNDAYYAYTTRGCGMNCGFCAVKTLEPEFKQFISIKEQIKEVEKRYGPKKDLLLMDNNVLKSTALKKIIDEIKELGFQKGATYKNPKTNKIKSRFVDFNQGLDAFLMTEEKAKLLGEIATRPARIAFDHIEDQEVYIKAITLAAKNGVNHLSNYILYNSDAFGGKGRQYAADTPRDLYRRLKINVDLQEKLNKNISNEEERIHIFSFPMRYIPLDDKQRGYVGTNWTKKYLRAVQRILIPTQGKGVSSKSFFQAAFGKDEDEFVQTILMPEMYIASRGNPEKIKNISDEERKAKINIFNNFESLRSEWRNIYIRLNEEEKIEFHNIIKDNKFNYYNYSRITNENVKKLYIHYGTSSGILTLVEELHMNEQKNEIRVISNYLKEKGFLIYKELIKYILESSKYTKRINMFKILFGNEGLSDLLIEWVNQGCKLNEFINNICKVYEIKKVYFYAINTLINSGVIENKDIEKLILLINTEEASYFIEKLLKEVSLNMKSKVKNEHIKSMIDEVIEESSIQLSLF